MQSTKPGSTLLSLHWPRPPRNLLLVQKLYAPEVAQAVVHFAKHVASDYPQVKIIVEPRVAASIRQQVDFPIYESDRRPVMADKVDIVATFGGDGTVLRAASLFKLHRSVPPILSFSMGSLGFLGEWDFAEYKRAWRELYMSGSDVTAGRQAAMARTDDQNINPLSTTTADPWADSPGKSLGRRRACKVLLRPRIKADVIDADGNSLNARFSETLTGSSSGIAGTREPSPPLRAVNEISVHRGSHPHLAAIDIYQNGRFLTETTADGILVSTPTGSTAYSLSAGGPIVHPLVRSLLITPISPCSLSFRSLVLPLDTEVRLRMRAKNRNRELELIIDGRRCGGLLPGSEVRIQGEFVGRAGPGEEWHGGVPCVVRAEDDPWVGGLNGLLKFNYPFGREPVEESES